MADRAALFLLGAVWATVLMYAIDASSPAEAIGFLACSGLLLIAGVTLIRI